VTELLAFHWLPQQPLHILFE